MDLSILTAGDKAPEEINVVIEIPQGSAVKYEIDEHTGTLEVDRFIGSTNVYPFNYGFIPLTKGNDGDALDALVISSLPVEPEALIQCRPIGILEMEDEHGKDDKVLCVPLNEVDPFYAHINDITDMDLPTVERIKLFFKQYKEMDSDRWSKVANILGRAEAITEIKKAMDRAA